MENISVKIINIIENWYISSLGVWAINSGMNDSATTDAKSLFVVKKGYGVISCRLLSAKYGNLDLITVLLYWRIHSTTCNCGSDRKECSVI